MVNSSIFFGVGNIPDYRTSMVMKVFLQRFCNDCKKVLVVVCLVSPLVVDLESIRDGLLKGGTLDKFPIISPSCRV